MAIALELEIRIDRPPGLVFDELVAVERWPGWLIASGIVGVERVDGAEPAPPLVEGTRLRIEQRVAGRASSLDSRVSAFDAPHRFGVHGRDADGIAIDIDATLVPDDHATRLRWSLRIRLPGRMRFFESMAAPQVRRAASLDLEAFRIRVESLAPA